MEERLQKIIAAAGLASRRQAEQWITEGRVRVNGNLAQLGDTADRSEDVVEVDGRRLPKEEPKRYLLLYKPRGFVTTLSDEQGRRNVSELTADCGVRVFPVGRLDLSSEGMLLMTNDGELANRLMHPSHEIEKTYLVWTDPAAPDSEKLLSRCIELDGRPIAFPVVRLCESTERWARWQVTIHEGRNRQVRRMCEAAGLHVTRLIRVAEGPLRLGRMKAGTWRDLTAEELESLRNSVGL